MYKTLIFLIIGIICSTCKQYENKDLYKISVGESIEVYYSTNSCCFYCIPNKQSLKHIALIGEKTIDKGPSNCDGCNYKAAFIFKALSSGMDTIKLKRSIASESCEESREQEEIYIVEVE